MLELAAALAELRNLNGAPECPIERTVWIENVQVVWIDSGRGFGLVVEKWPEQISGNCLMSQVLGRQ